MSCLAPLLLATAALIDPMPRVYDAGLASCAWVRAEGESAGTGFVVDVDKRWLVTCRHVVGDRKTVEIFFPWRRDGELVTDRQEYLSNRETLRKLGLLVSGKVLRTSDAADLALVELERVPGNVRAISFLKKRPRLAEKLLHVGNRQDLPTLWNANRATLRSFGPLVDSYHWRGTELARNAFVLIGQMAIEEGDSGGPVFNWRGELVGLAAAVRRQCPLAAILISGVEIRRFLDASTTIDSQGIELFGLDATPGERLLRMTAWVRPSATEYRAAATMITSTISSEMLYLTSARAVGSADKVPLAVPYLPNGLAVFAKDWDVNPSRYRHSIRGNWGVAEVLARDERRDLALLRTWQGLPSCERPVGDRYWRLAKSVTPGEVVHSMSHPSGFEFAWMYAAGSVSQRGRLSLIGRDDPERRVNATIYQIPSQGYSPGGPVVNAKDELVGVLAARGGPNGQIAYAASPAEIALFLDGALTGRVPQTFHGVACRCMDEWERLKRDAATRHAHEAITHLELADQDSAADASMSALKLTPLGVRAVLARALVLVAQGKSKDAASLLDSAIDAGRRDEELLTLRTTLAIEARDFRKARSVAELLQEVEINRESFRLLGGILFALGEDEKAAASYADFTTCAGEESLNIVCSELIVQVSNILERNPGNDARAADWIVRVLNSARTSEDAIENVVKVIAPVLESARVAKTDSERLRILKKFLETRAARK